MRCKDAIKYAKRNNRAFVVFDKREQEWGVASVVSPVQTKYYVAMDQRLDEIIWDCRHIHDNHEVFE